MRLTRYLTAAMLAVLLMAASPACQKNGPKTKPTISTQPTADSPTAVNLPPRRRNESEPNNTAKQATSIRVGDRVLGFVEQPTRVKRRLRPDYDWYRLTVPDGAARELRVSVTGISDVDLLLQIMHPTKRRPFMSANHHGLGGGETIVNYTTSGGEIFIRIRPKRRWRKQTGKLGPYKLSTRLVPLRPNLEIEPNEPASLATPLTLGTPTSGLITDIRDRDWFVIKRENSDALQRLSLNFVKPPEVPLELLLVYRLRPRHSVRVLPRSKGQEFILPSLGLLPGQQSLYIVVRPTNRRQFLKLPFTKLTVPYRLELKTVDAAPGTEIEPNDHPERATPVQSSMPFNGRINYPFDRDRYMIEVSKPSIAKIVVSGVPYLDLRLSFGRKLRIGPTIDEGGVGADEVVINRFLETGKHYLNIRSKGSSYNAETAYTVRLELKDATDQEREPNNKTKQAMTLLPGSSLYGYIHRHGDVDIYRIDLRNSPTAKLLAFTLSGVKGVNLSMTLKDKSDAPLAMRDAILVGVSKSMKIRLKPDLYFLVVADRSKRGANTSEQYKLKIK